MVDCESHVGQCPCQRPFLSSYRRRAPLLCGFCGAFKMHPSVFGLGVWVKSGIAIAVDDGPGTAKAAGATSHMSLAYCSLFSQTAETPPRNRTACLTHTKHYALVCCNHGFAHACAGGSQRQYQYRARVNRCPQPGPATCVQVPLRVIMPVPYEFPRQCPATSYLIAPLRKPLRRHSLVATQLTLARVGLQKLNEWLQSNHHYETLCQVLSLF
jgi:hypothetical protein